jgi:hypothetical protein
MRKPAITGLARPSGVDDTWSNPESAKKMMKKYAGNSSDLKNVRNVMGKKGINNVFDQLHHMAKSDEATRTAGKGNPYKGKKGKKVKRGAY